MKNLNIFLSNLLKYGFIAQLIVNAILWIKQWDQFVCMGRLGKNTQFYFLLVNNAAAKLFSSQSGLLIWQKVCTLVYLQIALATEIKSEVPLKCKSKPWFNCDGNAPQQTWSLSVFLLSLSGIPGGSTGFHFIQTNLSQCYKLQVDFILVETNHQLNGLGLFN